MSSDPHGNDALIALVRDTAARILRRDRPRYALLITPETGVRAVLRGELAARLADAGLIRESREAMRRARGDVESLLCWIEAGTGDEGEAVAQFRVLPMPRSLS